MLPVARPVRLEPALDEGEHDPSDLDVRERQFLLQNECQKEVEGTLEGVEVELEVANRQGLHGSGDASASPGHTALD